jgi:ribonuclease HI
MWTMFFDGASNKDSAGAGVVLISPSKEAMHLSFKIDFKTNNNIAEYEAFLLGSNSAKEMGIKGLKVFGDTNLIIQQVNNTFQTKHVRLKAYRDEVWKIRDSFFIFDISYVPRAMNHLFDSLVVSASMFIPPMPPKLNYEIQVKYRPSLPNNIKYWKVFEDDDELSRFLQVVDEFFDMHIDQKNQNVEESKKPKLKKKWVNMISFNCATIIYLGVWCLLKRFLIKMMSPTNLIRRRKIMLSMSTIYEAKIILNP